MKVLHIAAHLGGGAGKAIVGLSLSGAAAGGRTEQNSESLHMQTEIVILEQPQDKKYADLAMEHGIKVCTAPDAEKIRRKIEESDLVVLNWWNHPLTVRFLLHLPEVPFRMIIWNHINGCTYPYLPASFLDCFHAVLHTSRYSLENPLWSAAQAKRLQKKSQIVYGMGAFAPERMKPKKEYDSRQQFVVGYVGTLDYAKLHPEFVRFCEKVQEKIPDVCFLLAGRPSDEVKSDLLNSRIRDCVRLAGQVQEPERYYLQFDVFGYLLNGESYATTENSLLEAMAAGLPIVVLDQPVERHIIRQNENGYLVDTACAYADRLYELWRDADRRKEIGTKAREYVIRHYSAQDNWIRFQSVCQKVCSMPRTRFDFQAVIGSSPFEAFCYFAGKQGEQMAQCVKADGMQRHRWDLKGTSPIFWGTNKASVYQFDRYFQECGQFRRLLALKKENGNACVCTGKE